MPILNDRLTDQLMNSYQSISMRKDKVSRSFLTAYFDFLEKGILIFEQGTDLETIGLEDGEGSLLQERNLRPISFI